MARNFMQPWAEAAPGHEGVIIDLHEEVLSVHKIAKPTVPNLQIIVCVAELERSLSLKSGSEDVCVFGLQRVGPL